MVEGEGLDRRTFFHRLLWASALGAGTAGGGLLLSSRKSGDILPPGGKPLDPDRYRLGLEEGGPVLAVATGLGDGARLTREAVKALGGMKRFVKPGETVLVKPNVAFDRSPMLGATTSPEVAAEVVRLCLQAGAGRVIVADNPIHKPEGCFWKTGVGPAVKEAGGEVLLPGPGSFRRIPVPGTRVLRTWEVFDEPLRSADRVIGVAPVKDHNLCRASMGMKNWYGLLGGRRQQFHQKIHQVIADFLELLRPTLTVLDGTRVLMAHGPTGGSLSDVRRADTVAASTDPVAADAFGWTLLERKDSPPEYIKLAAAKGRGNPDWSSLDPVFWKG